MSCGEEDRLIEASNSPERHINQGEGEACCSKQLKQLNCLAQQGRGSNMEGAASLAQPPHSSSHVARRCCDLVHVGERGREMQTRYIFDLEPPVGVLLPPLLSIHQPTDNMMSCRQRATRLSSSTRLPHLVTINLHVVDLARPHQPLAGQGGGPGIQFASKFG